MEFLIIALFLVIVFFPAKKLGAVFYDAERAEWGLIDKDTEIEMLRIRVKNLEKQLKEKMK